MSSSSIDACGRRRRSRARPSARPVGQADVGPDARRDHQHVAVDRARRRRTRFRPAGHSPRCSTSVVRLSSVHADAESSHRPPQDRACVSSSWAFISVGPACTTSTVNPRFCSPRRPPARAVRRRSPRPWCGVRPRSIMPMQSSSVRKPKTPSVRVLSSAHSPAIGGKNDRLPVARISLS